eukprot:778953-Rhodomonas_salina.1
MSSGGNGRCVGEWILVVGGQVWSRAKRAAEQALKERKETWDADGGEERGRCARGPLHALLLHFNLFARGVVEPDGTHPRVVLHPHTHAPPSNPSKRKACTQQPKKTEDKRSRSST